MKRTIKYLLTLCAGLMAVICVAGWGGCPTPSSSKELVQLEMPTNLKADFWELTWEKVEGASGYTVRVLDEEYQTEETEFILFDYLSPNREYDLAVKALGDNENYSNSEWTTIAYHTEEVTQNLSVRQFTGFAGYVEGLEGTYEVAVFPNDIPNDGRVVFPDYINGIPVTSIGEPYTLNSTFDYASLKKVRLPNKLKQITAGFASSAIKEIYIPNAVEYISGFSNSKELTNVILPNSLIVIGNGAFSNCSSLSKMELSKNLQKIGMAAFQNTAIERIETPKTLLTIGNYAFEGSSLGEIVLSSGLLEIGKRAFADSKLSSLNIPKSVRSVGADMLAGTAWYADQVDGFLYIDDVICGYKGVLPKKSQWKTQDFKQGVRLFSYGLFAGRMDIEEFELPDSVERVADCMFEGCTNLREVSLPDSLTAIDKSAFMGCKNLLQIDFPKKLQSIAASSFSKSGIDSIAIPSSVREIGDLAFAYCNSLTKVSLEEGLERIGANAFSNCYNLEIINLPYSLKQLGQRAFYNCRNLSSLITIPSACQEIQSNTFYGCKNLTKIVLSDNITTIENYAFSGTGLTSAKLPKNLEELGYLAFYECSDLQSVTVSCEVKSLELSAFYGAEMLNTVYYTGTQTEWSKIEWTNKEIDSVYDWLTNILHIATRTEIDVWLDEFLENLTVYFYSEVKPTGVGNFWHYENGVPVAWS